MKNIVIFILLFVCENIFSQYHPKNVTNYYNKIVMNGEYSGKLVDPIKWTKDMNIYVDGENRDYLVSELNGIVKELNDLIDPIEIKIVNKKEDANYFIFFGYYKDFKKTYSVVNQHLLENNWGLFEVYRNNYGIMYVDIVRTVNIEAQKHLLREELTQSLGFLNDSYDYPESIFYEGWTTTTKYSYIDKEIIKMHYNK